MSLDQTLKEFHKRQKAKKEKWAQSYNKSTNERWGDDPEYGFHLAPPLPLEIIETFESLNDCKIPNDLRQYLEKYSSELFLSFYPYKFELPETPEFKNLSSKIPPEVTFIDYENFDELEWIKPDQSDDDWLDLEHLCCMLQISEGGCLDEDVIIIKGNQAGSIWAYCDDGMWGGYLHRYASFTANVVGHMKREDEYGI